ncbi:hypothetical protein L596_024125 [Steinernema carpocapsae]|nr:hypothetical protein L596_024125 [Steinernema carpocapsae]
MPSSQQTQPTVPKFSLCDSFSAASYMKSFNDELVHSLYHSTASGLVSPSANPYMIDPFYYSSAYVPNGAAAAAGLYNPAVYP